VGDFTRDVNSFSGYRELAVLATQANDSQLRTEGEQLAAVAHPRDQSAMDAVMLRLIQTCTQLNLIKAPPTTMREPINERAS
jgi:hypothetical protein